jgi:hypothetical protein
VTLTPRAVLIHRRTELEELLDRHGTLGQAAYFLKTRARRIEDIAARHHAVKAAIAATASAVPADWRRGLVERADLPRFLFAPDDIIVAVGQDGLVANVAKYLDGQVVIGINPEPARNPGVLVPHQPHAAPALLAAAVGPHADNHVEPHAMVEAATDDGQQLAALNEIYIGQASHQTARYTLTIPDGQAEPQASSGLLVATGTGATGWCRSAWLERKSTLILPAPAEGRLAWFVREAWPSPATGTALTEGDLAAGQSLTVTAESDQLTLFGDGIETDAIPLAWGQTAAIRLAPQTLRLLHLSHSVAPPGCPGCHRGPGSRHRRTRSVTAMARDATPYPALADGGSPLPKFGWRCARVRGRLLFMGSITWGPEIAEVYDKAYAAKFEPSVLGPIVDLLADLARGGPALEFAIGTGRVALPLRARGIAVQGIELSPHMAGQMLAKPGADAVAVGQGPVGGLGPGAVRLRQL